MKINDYSKKDICSFEILFAGDVFCTLQSREPLLCIEEIVSYDEDGDETLVANAVSLSTGKSRYISPFEDVIPLNTELNILPK